MGNNALCVTYKQNGQLRRAVLSQQQYNMYLKDSSIQELQIHANQSLMEAYFDQSNGINKPRKQILLG